MVSVAWVNASRTLETSECWAVYSGVRHGQPMAEGEADTLHQSLETAWAAEQEAELMDPNYVEEPRGYYP